MTIVHGNQLVYPYSDSGLPGYPHHDHHPRPRHYPGLGPLLLLAAEVVEGAAVEEVAGPEMSMKTN